MWWVFSTCKESAILILDYVGFIKKVMKLLQHGFPSIRKVEVTLAQLEESHVPPPTRPCE